ncbi:hypothetical protein BJX68DRAFT_78092 [Aspergillus pseudodeflectus]|uniref:Uncharacterized protein n=1 Tax=Aspergillus pseudodeflectus TaxID=176178 RepID=A0ABR4L6A4_9EURO
MTPKSPIFEHESWCSRRHPGLLRSSGHGTKLRARVESMVLLLLHCISVWPFVESALHSILHQNKSRGRGVSASGVGRGAARSRQHCLTTPGFRPSYLRRSISQLMA